MSIHRVLDKGRNLVIDSSEFRSHGKSHLPRYHTANFAYRVYRTPMCRHTPWAETIERYSGETWQLSAFTYADIFRRYLLSLLPVIGANVPDLQLIFDDEFNDRVVRFSADTGGVYKQKETAMVWL